MKQASFSFANNESLNKPEVKLLDVQDKLIKLKLELEEQREKNKKKVIKSKQPVKIIDLARRMIQLSGLTLQDEFNQDGDIAIEITGLRPGEKLYEELLIGNNPSPTVHSRIMKANEDFVDFNELTSLLEQLTVALDANDVGLVRQMLKDIVPGYVPSSDVVDWVHLAGHRASHG